MSPKLEEVFGVSSSPVLSYIQRAAVDDRFVEALKADKQIVVYGSSKQGKTSLVQEYLPYEKQIVVRLTPKTQIPDIYASILRQLGIQLKSGSTEVSGRETSGSDIQGPGTNIRRRRVIERGTSQGSSPHRLPASEWRCSLSSARCATIRTSRRGGTLKSIPLAQDGLRWLRWAASPRAARRRSTGDRAPDRLRPPCHPPLPVRAGSQVSAISFARARRTSLLTLPEGTRGSSSTMTRCSGNF